MPSFVVALLCALPAQTQDTDFVRQMQDEFEAFTSQQTADYEAFAAAEREAFEKFRAEIRAVWGDDTVSTKKDWVEYSDDRESRSVVDFESGEAVVEVLLPEADEEAPAAALDETELILAAIAQLVVDRGKTMDYPVLDQEPKPLGEEPVLAGQLAMPDGEPVTSENAEAFARANVEKIEIVALPVPEPAPEPVAEPPAEKPQRKATPRKARVKLKLVPNHVRIRAEKFVPLVHQMAGEYQLDPRLVFAVIHTESYFNPKARSQVPAYGLMQLVPTSGARDAYRHVYNEDKIVSPNYLYVPENNVRMGAAYLDLLLSKYFGKVEDADSRHYCAISAYNTGPGNVSRAITGKTRLAPAIARLNAMESEEVLETLKSDLPYEETRKYLAHILERLNVYDEWGA